jgi:hypothetical protein
MESDNGRSRPNLIASADNVMAIETPASHSMRPAAYFTSRWRGEVALGKLFWRDMLAIGTLVNLAASLGALFALALDASAAVWIAIHFLPLPYNLFLCAAVWRCAARASGAWSRPAQAGAVVWLIAATLI